MNMKKLIPNNSTGQALIYCRVSTAKQEERGTSLDSQANACIAHAKSLGYSVGRITKEVYSGAELFDRPLLSLDRVDIRAKMFQAVIVYAIDRLSRDIAHLSIIADEVERAGAKLIFITEDLDNTPEGKLMQSVRGYVAEVERQKIRERCVRGKRQKALNGRVVRGGTDLFGYTYDNERGARVIHDGEAATVRQIFRWAADGVSTRAIIRRLNEEGTPPPSEGKRTFRDGRKAYWGRGAVTRILNDRNYKGEAYAWRWKSAGRHSAVIIRPEEEWIRLPEGATPAIVTPELWEIVQERRKTNRGDEKRNETRPDLLRGHVFCAICGRRMRGDNERGNRRVYRCPSRFTPFGACGSKRIPSADCEALIWQKVADILKDPSILAAEIERRKSEGADSTAHLLADLDAARQSLRQVESELQRIITRAASADDELWAMFEKSIAEKKEAKKRLESIVADAEGRLAAEDADATSLITLSEYADRVRNRLAVFDFEEKRLALEALNAKICGNGREWRLDVSPPIAGLLPPSFCLSARPVQARRCSPSGCRPSCHRSNLKPRSN